MASSPPSAETSFWRLGVQLIGDVRIEDDASVWYNTVIRADLGARADRPWHQRPGRLRAARGRRPAASALALT